MYCACTRAREEVEYRLFYNLNFVIFDEWVERIFDNRQNFCSFGVFIENDTLFCIKQAVVFKK